MEIAWNQVTQQVLYTPITRQIRRQNFAQTLSQACIILKARGGKIMLFRLLIPYISLYASKERIWAGSILSVCVYVFCICVYLCMCIRPCLHVCVQRLDAHINKEKALVAYSQPWSTAREIILCSAISARELTVHHLDFAVYPRKGCIAWSRRSCSFLQCLL